MTRRERFWRWLHQRAEQAIRAHHMTRRRHDRKCPACLRWGALHGWTRSEVVDPLHTALTCAACDATSIWFEDGMAPFPVHPVTRQPLPRREVPCHVG